MYQLEQFEDHESHKETFEKYFDDTSADWFAPWSGCNALSTYKDNELFNKEIGDFLFQTSFQSLIKKAAIEHLGCKVSFKEVKFHAWLNVYQNNFFQEPHDHWNSEYKDHEQPDICFVYFFDVPDEPLFFFLEGSEQHYINETNGTIAFFDPRRMHGVDMNPEDRPRKSISGNLWIMTRQEGRNTRNLSFGNRLPTVEIEQSNG